MRWRRRPKQPPPATERGGRWNRNMLRLFGPPSVGRYEGAFPEVDPDPPCPSCGRPESEHTTYRTADGKTLRRCPG